MNLFILDDIELSEISGVDNPAQPTAKATIIKRSVKKEENMSDKVTDVTKALDEQKIALEKSFDEKLAKAVADHAKESNAILSMSADEVAVFKAMDGKERKELLDLEEDERKRRLKGKADKEEVVKFEGKDIRKSVVGEDAFELYKSLVASHAEIVKARDAEQLVRLEKRAADEFAELAGSDAEKAQMLKALDSMPAEVSKQFLAVMKTAKEHLAVATQKVGTQKAADEATVKKNAQQEYIAEIMKSDSLPRSKAMEKAARTKPELFK